MALKKQRRSITRLHDQDFAKIRAHCLKERRLFEDPLFPADRRGFYQDYDEMRPRVPYVWLRPGEISSDPVLVAGGTSRFDCKQGVVGNCWFIGAVSSFAEFANHSKEVFNQVVPKDQSFDKNYAGVFHFRFWQYGEWVEVVIDDRLPTKEDHLVSLCSSNKDEFWTALLESWKLMLSKLYGSYEALEGGDGSEALTDLTGSFSAPYSLCPDLDIFDELLKAYESKALIGCSTDTLKAEEAKGLVDTHYYTVTGVRSVPFAFLGERGAARMLRVRNPWGNDKEWEGPGSDESMEWNFIHQDVKDSMDLKTEEDGEFWMPYKYFTEKFKILEICRMCEDVEANKSVLTLHGTWVKGSATAQNPQHMIETLHKLTPTTVHIYLMEKNRRSGNREYQELTIKVYESGSKSYNHKKQKLDEDSVVASASFYGREVHVTTKLKPQTQYVVAPSRGGAAPGEYLLRVVHDNHIALQTVQ